MEKPKKKINWPVLIPTVALVGALTVWIAWANVALEMTTYRVSAPDLPQAFAGYRIAVVSDLHNCTLDADHKSLLDMLRQAQPDMIAITGDLIDSRKTDRDVALAFVRAATEIAPCYFVNGNHEGRFSRQEVDDFEASLTELGVTVLGDRFVTLEKEGQTIRIAGLNDPIYAKKHGGIGKTMDPAEISNLISKEEYTVLLTHRPEYFDAYVQAGADLALAGHMHGGQIRLPLLGGLFCPSHGFFPEYDAGMFSRDGTVMLVSRGIGNSIFPVRINNRPELVLVELECPQ